MVGRVQKMLNGKQQLIEAFNRLLLIDYQIADTSDENDHVCKKLGFVYVICAYLFVYGTVSSLSPNFSNCQYTFIHIVLMNDMI